MSTPASAHNLYFRHWPGRRWLRLVPLSLPLLCWPWLGWSALALLIPLWWLQAPPRPRQLWLRDGGLCRLDGQPVALGAQLQSPLLVMFQAGRQWFWVFRPELNDADWRRLRRVLAQAR
ncbi:hypothetical protein [Gallaecimonas sp. GXIMD1310]|uniref:hypothetical protein n=1 Tax=Gallaecimonas sp. GXIMD1310 TaxID=3131926 RepID=UPI00324BDFFB